MSRQAVLCIVKSQSQAAAIVDTLRDKGICVEDISILFPDTLGTKDFAHEKHSKAPESAIAGVGTGGVLGGAFGWLVGIGSLAIPGLGAFVAAGPIMAALSGAAVGATIGGLAGALVGMGIPEYEAKQYEGKMQEGNILISVHAETNEDRDNVRDVFNKAGADDISVSREATIR